MMIINRDKSVFAEKAAILAAILKKGYLTRIETATLTFLEPDTLPYKNMKSNSADLEMHTEPPSAVGLTKQISTCSEVKLNLKLCLTNSSVLYFYYKQLNRY